MDEGGVHGSTFKVSLLGLGLSLGLMCLAPGQHPQAQQCYDIVPLHSEPSKLYLLHFVVPVECFVLQSCSDVSSRVEGCLSFRAIFQLAAAGGGGARSKPQADSRPGPWLWVLLFRNLVEKSVLVFVYVKV